eukprot:jgi/Botrbrau1/7566/Bobra.0159s0016.1
MGKETPHVGSKQAKTLQQKLVSALSGSLSGAVVAIGVQPLDVLRTRMQADAAGKTFMSTLSTYKDITSTSGIRGLWRGTGPTIVRISFGVGVQFFMLESLRDFMLTRSAKSDRGEAGSQQLTAAEAFITGSGARALATVCTCPVTVVKTRMEYGSYGVKYRGTFDALATIGRTEGLRGLFRGLVPTVLANAPFSGLYYMFYTGMQNRLSQTNLPKTAVNVSAGVVAAMAATLITQPADIVRTQMQLGLLKADRLGTLGTLRTLLRDVGPRVLFAGLLPRVMKRTLQTVLVWTLYEEIQPRFIKAAGEVFSSKPVPGVPPS